MAIEKLPEAEIKEVTTTERAFSRFLRRKSPEELIKCSEKTGLNRALSAFDLVVLGVGAVIGAGIFALSGTAAAGGGGHIGAGPALVVSLVFAAIACSFAALCYAEFAALIPVAGSAFTYTYATLGELAAWFIGWMLVLEYIIGNIAVASSWSGYMVSFLKGFEGSILPSFITNPPVWLVNNYTAAKEAYIDQSIDRFVEFLQVKFTAIGANTGLIAEHFTASKFDPSVFNPVVFERMGFNPEILLDPASQIPHLGPVPLAINLPAIAIMAIITYFLYVGIKESAKMTFTMVLVKIFVILLFIGVGIVFINPENWTPFAPNGIKGIFVGAYLMFFAYIGFDAVSTAAEETKNPQKDMPIGIIGTLAICTLLYIGVIAVLTGIVPLGNIDTQAPISAAMHSVSQHWVAFLISIGAIAGLTSVLLVLQLGGTRILYAMSRDKFIPGVFSKLHRKYKTPHINTLIVGFIVAAAILVLDLNAAAELCNIGTLAAFMLVCAGVRVLRKIDPQRHRPFKVPFVPLVPILGILTCLALVVLGLPTPKTLIIFGVWVLLGLFLYFTYGHKKVRLHGYNDC